MRRRLGLPVLAAPSGQQAVPSHPASPAHPAGGLKLFSCSLLLLLLRSQTPDDYDLRLPLSLTRRWIQYGILYGLLLLPEIWTIGWLRPTTIHYLDACGFILSGYAVLLLLNSILFLAPVRIGDFLRINLGIFGILYVAVLADDLIAVSGFFLLLAGCLFYGGYRRYSR